MAANSHPSLPRSPEAPVAPLSVASAEVLRQVRRIEVRTRRLVDSHFAGAYRSLFKGQGMEFAEVREYQPGDEVRAIDWNVSARMGRPFVKRYVEERELTIMLVVDMSGSSRFGTRARFKHDLAIEMAGVLALAATRNNDRVGLLMFSDRVEHALPARKGRKHALRLIRDLLTTNPIGRGTSVAVAVDRLMRLLPHRSVVFFASDFLAEDLETPLARLAQRHDVIAVTLEDPSERVLPDIGPARLQDPESGEVVEVNTSHPLVREAFATQVADADARRRKLFDRLGLDEIEVHTEHGYVDALLTFFRARTRRPHGAVRTGPPRALAPALALCALLLASPSSHARAQAVSSAALPAPEGSGVRAGFLVRPDTVEVGDPFTLIVTVVVPEGARVEWPTMSDSTAMVVRRAPTKITTETQRAGGRTERATYALAAWNVGTLPIAVGNVIIRYGANTLTVPVTNASVFVRSVLSGDSSMYRPKPPRDLFPRVVPWWQRWWPVLVLLAVLGVLWWLRQHRRPPAGARSDALRDPYARALHDFERLDRLALADAGERGRYVALAIDVLRSYLAQRQPLVLLSMTSSELVSAMAHDSRVPHDRLLSLVTTGDEVKFARHGLSVARAHALVAEARAVVDVVEAAERENVRVRLAADEAARATSTTPA